MKDQRHWNYRIMKARTKYGDAYGIYEVYYLNDEVTNWSKNPISSVVVAEFADDSPLVDLKTELHQMLESFDKDILDYDNQGSKIKRGG